MRNDKRYRITAGLLASLLALAGCGGGSSSSSDSSQLSSNVKASDMVSAATTAATSDATVTSTSATSSGTSAAPQVITAQLRAQTQPSLVAPVPAPNSSGVALTVTSTGTIDTSNPFFRPMGNGRSCATCHQQAQGWSMTPDSLAARFSNSGGNDPVFQLVDGSNSPNAAVATLAQKQLAYSMLITKGLIRVGLPMPANAEFKLVKVDDPYGFASASQLSLFRRPLPTTNLKFQTAVMWDGRETLTDPTSTLCVLSPTLPQCFASHATDLAHQSNDAVMGHAQFAAGLNAADQQAIVNFETGLFTAQITDSVAGSLTSGGALGGAQNLMNTNFYFGINDFANGDYQTKAPFQRNVFSLYNAWNSNPGGPGGPGPGPGPGGRPGVQPTPSTPVALAQASIARGQQIFNTRPFNIVGVNGLNDDLGQSQVRGTCATCHDTPNVGSLSVIRFLNTGVSAANLRTPDLPLYTLQNIATGETIQTTDPARALITGKWRDIGRVKVPNLRALESRSPYFHNGSGSDLTHLIQFYDRRFRIGFSTQERADLEAFLKTL